MNYVKAPKPKLNIINPDTITDQVNEIITEYCETYGIDIYNYNQRVNIKHNEVNNILRYCYKRLFKPDRGLYNNQKSLIDYDDIEQLQVVVDVFLDVCTFFNKALGLWSFGLFTGIADSTLLSWISPEGETLNPKRSTLIKSVREYNKGALISNLKDSPVGALAVANNDVETGLEWSKQQAALQATNAVYILPSERSGRLKLDKLQDSDGV